MRRAGCGPGLRLAEGVDAGAGRGAVRGLPTALESWAYALARDLPDADGGIDLRHGPGTGASGGPGVGLAALGARAELIITAEVARRAKLHGRPVLALALALAEAVLRASELLADATERALRMIVLGARVTAGDRTADLQTAGTQRPSSVR